VARAVRIGTNIASIAAQRSLVKTSKMIVRSLERLSTGLRVNRAADDAASLARGEGLTGQIRGINRAILNIGEAKSVLTIAEGAISTQFDLLQRMRELAVQSANGTLGSQHRSQLNGEFQTLLAELDRTARSAEWNGTRLLDGSAESFNIQVGARAGDQIAMSGADTRVATLFGQVRDLPTFTFSIFTRTAPSFTMDSATGDFDNDGDLDVALGNLNSPTFWRNDGKGQFTTLGNLIAAGGSRQMIAVDLNKDGHLDLVRNNNWADRIQVALGRGDFTFETEVSYAVGTPLADISVRVADVDGDGYQDLIGYDPTGAQSYIYLNDTNGAFSLASTVALNPRHVADLNGDGRADFVTVSAGAASVYLGDGEGSFTFTQSVDNSAWNIRTADINNDGHLDLIHETSTGGDLLTRLGNGDGTFQDSTFIDVPLSIGTDNRALEVGDMDNDGDIDLVFARRSAGTHIFSNDGQGNFSTTQSIYDLNLDNPQADLLDLADMDGDGYLDLVEVGDNPNLGIGYHVIDEEAYVPTLSLETQEESQDVLALIDEAIERLSSAAAGIGSQQNRLDYAANTALLTVENLQSARSELVDADLAAETAELVRLQFLQQAQVSVLGQANLGLMTVLSLLRV
jgi:flagellin